MKKFLLSFTAFYLLSFPMLLAQNTAPFWSLAGNSNATATSKLGTTNDVNLRFYTKNVLRMIINSVAGNVGIGMGNPTSRLQINSPAGTDPFRVQLNTSTKLMVHSSGGVTIGAISTPPPNNSLYVSGSVGIGTVAAARADSGMVRVVNSSYYLPDRSTEIESIGIYTKGLSHGLVGYGYHDEGDDGATGIGVYGNGGSIGLSGYSVEGIGMSASSTFGSGVYASAATSGYGVYATSWDGEAGRFQSFNNTGVIATTTNGVYAGYFIGAVYASKGYFTTSDRNLKENVNEFGEAMSIITKLKPQRYEFKKDAKYASLHLPKGSHYGLLAQDLEQVLPNLVSEAPHELIKVKPKNAAKPATDGKPFSPVIDKKEVIESINIKAVNYVELIPIMIKAMQEQQVTIQDQNAKIEALTHLVNQLSVKPSAKLTGAYLGQSTPNPNSNSTRITYNIPAGFSKAELIINNEPGEIVKQVQLTQSGLIDIDTSRLSAGTYFYTLFVNGTSVDTKKMIVTR